MDSITIRLISKKFQVPPEVMGQIDSYLLEIYREEHRQKIIIDDLTFLLEKVKIAPKRNHKILTFMDMFVQLYKEAINDDMSVHESYDYSILMYGGNSSDSLHSIIRYTETFLRRNRRRFIIRLNEGPHNIDNKNLSSRIKVYV